MYTFDKLLNNMAKHDRKALLIRIPTKTWKAIKVQAGQNNRSVTAEISNILETSTLPKTAIISSNAQTIVI